MRSLALALLALLILELSGFAQNNCMVCHSEIRVDYVESAHAPVGVGCVDCHGGDPTTLDYRTAHAEGFKGTPKRAEIPQLCASCHADPLRMKPYGLRIDQYAEYQTSEHGKAFSAGDVNVAICTDCHTSHSVMSRFEPRSSVHPANLPQTCARCHADPELMLRYGLRADVFAGFREGVHGIALLKMGNPKAPTCATCHGLHGSTLLQSEDIVTVCGTCHIAERQQFDKSPHRSVNSAEFKGCAACHDSHQIAPAQSELFDSVCARCHSGGTDAQSLGQKLKTLLTGPRSTLAEAEAVLEQAAKMAFDLSGYRSRLHEAKTNLLQARTAQHSLNSARVEELTRRAHAIANDIRSEAHSLQTAVQIRWLGLTLVWGYLILVLIVLYLYRQARQRQ